MATSSFEKEIKIETNEAAKLLADMLSENNRKPVKKTGVLDDIERSEERLKKLFSR